MKRIKRWLTPYRLNTILIVVSMALCLLVIGVYLWALANMTGPFP